MLISSESKISQSTIFALMLLLIAGCAAVKPPEQGIVADAPQKQDEGIAFGILNASSYDSKGDKHSMEAGPDISYSISYGTSSNSLVQRFTLPIGADLILQGHTKFPEVFFAKRLPAGDYYVYELYRSTPGASGRGHLDARFTVTPNKATYIGSLQVEFHGARGLLGDERSAQRVAMKVTNELDKATNLYKERNPRLPYEITVNLMTIGK